MAIFTTSRLRVPGTPVTMTIALFAKGIGISEQVKLQYPSLIQIEHIYKHENTAQTLSIKKLYTTKYEFANASEIIPYFE